MNKKKSRFSKFLINYRRIISCYKYNFLELLATKIKFFENLLMSWRKPVFLNEIKLANVTEKDKVLLIGCGIFPSEAMLIADQTKAKVVCIDNSIKAVNMAKKIVKKKGVFDLVKIEYADGINYHPDDFNVVFIAINVWPIDLVLRNLAKNLKTNTRVLCKSSKNDILDVIENERLLESFRIESKLENPKTQSFLLIKK
ncbi:MAG: class I SAM-dependent methyltransferase [Candidatus Thermoplasmatota archaeon]|nr:class I SAM-dependent methyltransferase [Candidatus Thermoplasmatota archaeon]